LNREAVSIVFKELSRFVEADTERWRAIDAKFVWLVTAEEGPSEYLLEFGPKTSVRTLLSESGISINFRLACEAAVLEALLDQELSPQAAFSQGRLKIAGDARAALRLQQVLELWQKALSESASLGEGKSSGEYLH